MGQRSRNLLPKSMIDSFGLVKGDTLNFSVEEQQVTIKNNKDKLIIPEFKLEDLLNGFENYQNHFEWQDTPLVGEEIIRGASFCVSFNFY